MNNHIPIRTNCKSDSVFWAFLRLAKLTEGRNKEAQGWKKRSERHPSYFYYCRTLVIVTGCAISTPQYSSQLQICAVTYCNGWYKNNGGTPNGSKHPTKVVLAGSAFTSARLVTQPRDDCCTCVSAMCHLSLCQRDRV